MSRTIPSPKGVKDMFDKTIVDKVEPYVTDKTYKKWDPLQKYNMILFIIHLIIAIVLIIYFSKLKNSANPPNYVNLDLFQHAFKLNDSGKFYEVFSKQILNVGESGVATLIVTFFAITAAFHLLYAINPGNIYLDAVKRGNKPKMRLLFLI